MSQRNGFNLMTVVDTNPTISFTSVGSSQAGTMTGTLSAASAFDTQLVVSGDCTKIYGFEGDFTGSDSFSGTLTAFFTSSVPSSCLDCTNQSLTVAGIR